MYGEKLIELREERNLKIQDVAAILNIHRTVYGKYEKENINKYIPVKHLETLCNYFQVSFDFVFSNTNIKNYKNNNNNIDMTLSSNRIKEFRKDQKLSQVDLAKVLNTTQSMISDYEHAKNFMPIVHIYTISKKYNISADYLLGKIDNPKYI